jgi:hypothetical protein
MISFATDVSVACQEQTVIKSKGKKKQQIPELLPAIVCTGL